MTAPRRLMRSASQCGTRPPWSGRSALPAGRAIVWNPRFEVGLVHVLYQICAGTTSRGGPNPSIAQGVKTSQQGRVPVRRALHDHAIKKAHDDLLLLETTFERTPVTPPPQSLQPLDHDLENNDVVTRDIS